MNKKKLALTLLLSSASVSVFAVDAGTPTETPVVSTTTTNSTPATPTVVHEVVFVEQGTAGTETVTTETITASPVVVGAPVIVDGKSVAVVDGYFASAWAAVKSNQVATAVLVTTAVFVGAVVHAAVSSNNDVEADDAE